MRLAVIQEPTRKATAIIAERADREIEERDLKRWDTSGAPTGWSQAGF
jgi:hypothetical protein